MQENESSTFQPKPLNDDWSEWLIGHWEGSAESSVGNAQVWMHIYYGLMGQFLIIESESLTTEINEEHEQYYRNVLGVSEEDIEASRGATFKGLQIFTIDPETDEVVGYLFDSLRCIAQGRGKRKEDQEVTQWKWSETGEGATSVSTVTRISQDRFTLQNKYDLPNGNSMEDRIEMMRKVS